MRRKTGGLRGVLLRHTSGEQRAMLEDESVRIEYKAYDWGLNDQEGLGKRYSRSKLYLDGLKSWFD